MPIELNENSQPALTSLSGFGTFTIAAGQSLKIETTPGGADILDAEVPAGKSWSAYIEVKVIETDA